MGDPLVKNCLVASANPTKSAYFMNPAVRAIFRAYAAAAASSPPLADDAKAIATVQHVCVNTHSHAAKRQIRYHDTGAHVILSRPLVGEI